MDYFIDNYDEEIEEILESFKVNPEREKHLDLLADAFFDNLQRDNVEYGGIGLDSKRPFGNSNVEPDIAEIIGFERDDIYDNEELENYCRNLYDDLGTFLQYRWKQFKQK